jgi:RNA polymerase sigma-70 factor (ECF subfamily)
VKCLVAGHGISKSNGSTRVPGRRAALAIPRRLRYTVGMSETHSSLLRRVRDPKDAASWQEFVALYEPLLLSYVRSRGLNEHDARDVVQEILAGLVTSMPDFQFDRSRGRFRTWLWQVTQNALVNAARKKQRRTAAETGWRQRNPTNENQPDEQWLTSYRQRVLDFALEQVRGRTQPATWACFEQHILQGRASKDVAAALGVSANVVYVNASRVLARVREQCAEYLEELGDE